MNAFLNGPVALQLGRALLHFLWQGAAVAALFALGRLMTRRCSAQTRYIVACGALLLMAAAPVMTLSLDPTHRLRSDLVLPNAAGSFERQPVLPGLGDGIEPGFLPGLLQGTVALLEHALPWVASAWFFGVMLLSFRWFEALRDLRFLTRQEEGPIDPVWFERLRDLQLRLEISRPVRLLKSALVEVPMVIGWLRPVILLPASTLTGLTPAQLDTILAHELAHVRRHDYLINALQTLTETLLFYHPAVWWVSRCIREEREHCCDDLVVRLWSDRLTYANALVALEELRAACPAWALAASGSPLLARIRRLLGFPPDRAAGARAFAGISFLGLACALIVAGVWLWFSPMTYQGSVRVRLDADRPARLETTDGKLKLELTDASFMQTELEILRSRSVLNGVIERLDLAAAWGRRDRGDTKLPLPAAFARLRSHLKLRPVGHTSLIDICVLDEEANEAARIANAIAASYREFRVNQSRGQGELALKPLEDRLAIEDGKIQQAQNAVTALSSEFQIPEQPSPSDNQPDAVPLVNAESLRRIESLRIESQAELVRQQTLFTKLKELRSAELADALPMAGLQDNLLNSLLEQANLAEQKLVTLRHDYGPQHAEVVKTTASLKDLQAKIRERTDGVMLGLDAKVASLQQSLKNLQAEVEEAKVAEAQRAQRARPYLEARRNLEELRRARQVLLDRIEAARLDLEAAAKPGVEVVDAAVPPLRPISPNRLAALALIVCGLCVGFVGLVMARPPIRMAGV